MNPGWKPPGSPAGRSLVYSAKWQARDRRGVASFRLPTAQDIMPDNTPFDPWDSLADSLGAKPAADSPKPQPQPPTQPVAPSRPREKPPTAKRPQAEETIGGDWDALADSLGIAPAPRDTPPPRPAPPRRAAEPAQPRVERPPVRESTEERRGGARDARGATSWEDDDIPPRRPASAAAEERLTHDEPSEVRGEDRGESRSEGRVDGDGRGRRRRGRRGGRGRRRDDDRPAATGGERDQTDRVTGELREREPRELDRAREGREERPARRSEEPRSSEPRSGSRTHDDEPGRRRLPADDDFDSIDGDSERDQRLLGFNDIEDAAEDDRRLNGENERQDDEARPRKRRRRGRRGGRSRVRGRDDEAPALDSDRQAGLQDGDDEPLPASYGSRGGPRAEPAARGEDDLPPAEARETAEGSSEESSSRTRGRRRRRRGDRPRSGTDEPRKAGTPERRESSRSRSGDSRRGRTGDARSSSRSRGRRDDFAPVSGRYDEDDEGLEFLGVEEAVRDTAPRAHSAEDDDVLTESGLNSVLDVPSWVEAIGIVIAGNLAGRSSRGSRSEGGNGRSR